MRRSPWLVSLAVVALVVVCTGAVIAIGPDDTSPAGWHVKTFKSSVDGNQEARLDQKVNDWLALNEKSIQVVSITPVGFGTPPFAMGYAVVYKGAARETEKKPKVPEGPAIPPDPLDKGTKNPGKK